MGVSQTSYSVGVGGAPGYLNIGGWNSTLTDVNTIPAEVCGAIRQEGANTYMYVMHGSQSAARGCFVRLCTAIADDSGSSNIAPLRCTSVPTSVTTDQGKIFGVVVATNIYTNQYHWVLRKGVMTGYWSTNTGGNVAGAMFCPSATTANTFTNPATNTACGYVLDPAASATSYCGAVGVLVYVNFEGQIGSP